MLKQKVIYLQLFNFHIWDAIYKLFCEAKVLIYGLGY